MQKTKSIRPLLMLLTLMLMLSACSSKSISSPVAPPAVPVLPMEARQPTPPAYCSPTCSAGLMKLRQTWQLMLTEPE